MTLAELVKERLHEMFLELAEDISIDDMGLDLTEDEAAGVPMALFKAEETMRAAFERLISEGPR